MLEVRSLTVSLIKNRKVLRTLVDNISINILKATIAAIVGESGSGKSLTAYSIINLMPSDNLKIIGGQVIFQEYDILSLKEQDLREIRGKKIFLIPQDPLTALNPVLTIEEQIKELFEYHTSLKKNEITERCISLLEMVKIDNPRVRLKGYPHQLSGGQRQRILIAMSMALNPSIIIADEPTTALDASLQAEIMEIFLKIRESEGTSIILITHDFGIVNLTADYIYVMYGGKIVEQGKKEELLSLALHPYTTGLIKSVPSLQSIPKSPLPVMEGYATLPKFFCPFYERCVKRDPLCKEPFSFIEVSPTHKVLCRKVG